ncbi:MAG: hypothetical protein U9R23_04085 [Candidatus Cloacimonadota bacterium]|nr:hypothetical protein [Candidatus Cloacimonadota bacterium]
MGPTILLDKSTLQSLSWKELSFLYRYYYLNIPPVLIIEILGDLKKFSDDKIRGESEVKKIANKLSSIGDKQINAHYSKIAINSLLGYPIKMKGIPISHKTPFISRNGAMLLEESPEEKALKRWQIGEFIGTEQILAKRWRETTRGYDLDLFKKNLKKIHKKTRKVNSYDDLNILVEELLDIPFNQKYYIRWTIQNLDLIGGLEKKVLERWEKNNYRTFKNFAPYAYYFFKVDFAFQLGLLNNNLIGTKSTNRVDLEYLYYLPFTEVFSSGDKFLIEFSKIFLNKNQYFITRDDLKKDLKSIYEYFNENPEKDNSYPPENKNSFTYQIWQKYRPTQPSSISEWIESIKKQRENKT